MFLFLLVSLNYSCALQDSSSSQTDKQLNRDLSATDTSLQLQRPATGIFGLEIEILERGGMTENHWQTIL